MGFITKMINFVHTEAAEPRAFGILHLLFIFMVIGISVLLCVKLRDASDSTFRTVIGGAFFVMLMLEVLKQIFVPMSIIDGEIVYDYVWGDFPFQLCSTPLYVLPFLSFLPDGRVRDLAASYTMTFALIGGVAVYLTPKTVFSCRVAINVQTMIHHGLQIITGVFTAAYYRHRLNRRFFLGGVSVFAVLFLVANVFNTVGYDFLVSHGFMAEGETFNMFYVSPRADQTTPIFAEIFKSVPPIVFILGYFVVLTLGAALIIYCTKQICAYCEKRGKKISDS